VNENAAAGKRRIPAAEVAEVWFSAMPEVYIDALIAI